MARNTKKAPRAGTVDADGYTIEATSELEGNFIEVKPGTTVQGKLEKAFMVNQKDGSGRSPAIGIRDAESDLLLLVGVKSFFAEPVREAHIGDSVKLRFDRLDKYDGRDGKERTAWRGFWGNKHDGTGKNVGGFLK